MIATLDPTSGSVISPKKRPGCAVKRTLPRCAKGCKYCIDARVYMRAQGQAEAFGLEANSEPYGRVVEAIQRRQGPTISVPELSKLLGVKATTLNARFRRQRTSLKTVGRTNFIPLDLALNVTVLHKYALLGWPTLQQASRLTGVKAGTLKARCEKGWLEGHTDLTKRLRLNPAELNNLQVQTTEVPIRHLPQRARPPRPARGAFNRTVARLPRKQREAAREISERRSLRKTEPFVLAPAPEPRISLITATDYGLLDPDQPQDIQTIAVPKVRTAKPKRSGCLSYDPDRPFSVSDCAIGQPIKYGPYSGTIAQIINDPFSPKILAKFPEHQHPLMREVLLIVERCKG